MFNVKWNRFATETVTKGQIVSWHGYEFRVVSVSNRKRFTYLGHQMKKADLVVEPLTEIDDEYYLSLLKKGNVAVA